MIDENKVTKINCYVCEKEAFGDNGFFPFCSQKCKDEWNKDRVEIREKKKWTIPEIQSRLLEMGREASKKITIPEKKIDGGDQLFDVAKMIFG